LNVFSQWTELHFLMVHSLQLKKNFYFKKTTTSLTTMPAPSNTISLRIYDFLKQYPPFSLIDQKRLQAISAQVIVRYFEAGQTVFQEGDPPGAHIYLVKEGSVALRKGDQLVDKCDEGDLFGVRSMLSRLPYILTALVQEESLLYAVPIALFELELERTPQVALFFAAGLASGQSVVRYERSQIASDFKQGGRYGTNDTESDFHLFQLDEVLQQQKKQQLLHCMPETSIQEAARLMSEARVGSILVVNDSQAPIGIVTDTDFRDKVVTGRIGLKETVSKIMSSPVITSPPQSSVSDLQIKMLQKQVHHICLTEDGSSQGRAVGIITDHDLLLVQASNITVLIKQAQKARQSHELRYIRDQAEKLLSRYIQREVDIRLISEMITAVNDTIIHTAISLAEHKIASDRPEGLRYCWLSLGSEGRKEQLLRTDQDNALLYDAPQKDDREVQEYVMALAHAVNQSLMECGFEKCPADIMASNPRWCQPLSGWKAHFSGWIEEPEPEALMHASIFFDFRPTYGDSSLADALFGVIQQLISKQSLFLNLFANNALMNPPPLSFFRNFVVEKSGEHKDEFDIKRRAMMPLADAARVLCYEQGIAGITSTMERFEALAKRDKNREKIYRDAADGYGLLMALRTREGLRDQNSGRYIHPQRLNKIQRQSLRAVFETITEVQEILRHRFQLDYLRR
jgi:CBS domain-containing protein